MYNSRNNFRLFIMDKFVSLLIFAAFLGLTCKFSDIFLQLFKLLPFPYFLYFLYSLPESLPVFQICSKNFILKLSPSWSDQSQNDKKPFEFPSTKLHKIELVVARNHIYQGALIMWCFENFKSFGCTYLPCPENKLLDQRKSPHLNEKRHQQKKESD